MVAIPDPERIAPVDVAVIGFEGDTFNGDIAPALLELVEAGVVFVIDLVFVRKALDGSTSWIEVSESDEASAFTGLANGQVDMLSDGDLAGIAEDLAPGTAAMVVVWENRWLSRLASAIFESGGFLVSQDRIPHDVVVTAIDALSDQ